MTPPRRRLALGSLALALTVGATGCGSTSPGAAATLATGGDISTRVLEELVTPRLAAGGAELADQRPELQRQVLSQLLRSRLLERAAGEEGVSVSEGEVDDALRGIAGDTENLDEVYQLAQEQAGLDREQTRRLGRDEALRAALGEQLSGDQPVGEADLRAAYEQAIGQYDTASVKIIALPDRALAEQTLAELQADPGRFDAVAAERSVAEAGEPGQVVEVPRGSSPPGIDGPLFATPPGGLTLVEEGQAFFVVQVVSRDTVPFEQARPDLEAQLLEPQRQAVLTERLTAEATELEISVNPRFGRWDPTMLQVVAEESELSRPEEGAPAQTDPLGTVPGESVPGGTAPGGTAPGGTAPGGTAPGAP